MHKPIKDDVILPWMVMAVGLVGVGSAWWLLQTFVTCFESEDKWARMGILALMPLHFLNLAGFCGFAGFTLASHLWGKVSSPWQARMKMTGLLTGALWAVILIRTELQFPMIRLAFESTFSQPALP